jgi:putative nucleotidyltransferase with HDIG domain
MDVCPEAGKCLHASDRRFEQRAKETMSAPLTPRANGASGGRSDGRGRGGHRLSAAFEDVERVPTMAESRRRVLLAARRPSPSDTEIVEIVESDAALAMAVMRAANNGRGPGRGSVSGIPHAVEMLEPDGVESVALGVETYELFEQPSGWRALPERFRAHGSATRAAVERIGDIAGLPGQDELSVAALLHDVGKLVMARLHPGYEGLGLNHAHAPEDRARAELREFGIDHALVGGVLTRRWGLPDRICRAIERHHATDATGSAAAVRLADMVANHALGARISPQAVSEVAEALGLNPSQVHRLFYEYPYRRTARRRASEPCPLSARELDALRGLAEGKVYKEIANEMSLSASTVRTHLHNVYRKIGAVDRAQAVLVAHERGWL